MLIEGVGFNPGIFDAPTIPIAAHVYRVTTTEKAQADQMLKSGKAFLA